MEHTLPNASMLPSSSDLRGKLQSLAMLDAILSPDWEMRYFSCNSAWGPGETMSSMRDGQGSEFFVLFNAAGVAGKIYCSGSSLGGNVASALAQIPGDFSSFLGEPAFSVDTATCYLWRRPEDRAWSVAPEGTVELPFLAFVVDQGEHYCAWAQDYYEIGIKLDHVRALFRHERLTPKLVVSLNPEIELDAVLADCRQIGYPH